MATLFPELVFDDIESLRSIYIRKAKRLFLEIAIEQGLVSMDDIRLAIEMPEELNPKLHGEIASCFKRLKYVTHLKFDLSRRKIAHSRPITLWRLIDRTKAEAWLQANPDVPWPVGYEP